MVRLWLKFKNLKGHQDWFFATDSQFQAIIHVLVDAQVTPVDTKSFRKVECKSTFLGSMSASLLSMYRILLLGLLKGWQLKVATTLSLKSFRINSFRALVNPYPKPYSCD